jgi:hypothetical protein
MSPWADGKAPQGEAARASGPYDAGMQLTRSRNALRQATQAVDELRDTKNDAELFRDRFPLAMGAVQRVGSIIDYETKGRRTSEFGDWWKRTQGDLLFVFMREVRNAEFKRGDRRQRATHHARAEIRMSISISGSAEVLDKEGRVVEGGRLSELPPRPSYPPSPQPPTTVNESTDWYFWGGGQYDGHEVFSVIDHYLAWLKDEVLPTAERLTR